MRKDNTGCRIYIDAEKCKGCGLCLKACPKGLLSMSEKTNKKGHKYIIITDPDKCSGCGLCFMMCPDCGIEIKGK